MKKKIMSFAAAIMVTAFCLTSCESKEENARENVENAQENVVDAQNDLNAAEANYEMEIENYRRTNADRIAANEVTIEQLKADMKDQKKEAKEAYKQRVAELEERNRIMKDKMNGYKAEGKDKWENFKTEFNHDMDELGNALSDLGKNNVK